MKILITAGTTHEHIDPVRFISNASSGLQGVLLAETAIEAGYDVILIIGPNYLGELYELKSKCYCSHNRLKVIDIISAEDMYKAAMEYFSTCDVAICSAAVGDYRVKDIATDKIKRNGDSIILELIPNPDIAKSLGEIKTDKQILIGFALETSNGIENAKSKILKKNLDFVVLNETSSENPAFGSSTNIVSIISKSGDMEQFSKMYKKDIANQILKLIYV
jgi:phosphopantothenoylcysteine decarboxylase / phosphopantothenate---cysteine ligase